jgi:ABC-type glutathione transport system ATPase component
VIIDPSAASFKAELTKRGIWHVDADNEVNDGIRLVSMVLNKRLVRFCRQTVKKTTQELQDVSLTISLGMFGLLGPNGAGKFNADADAGYATGG